MSLQSPTRKSERASLESSTHESEREGASLQSPMCESERDR